MEVLFVQFFSPSVGIEQSPMGRRGLRSMHKSLCRLSLMAVLGLGSLTSVALAQDATPPPPPPDSGHMGAHGRGMSSEEQLKHLTKTLNLTADQQAQIKPILDSSHQQMQQIHQD